MALYGHNIGGNRQNRRAVEKCNVNRPSRVMGRCQTWLGLAALLCTSLPATSQTIEYAGDSAIAAYQMEGAWPNSDLPVAMEAVRPAPVFNQDRIMGVMPDYQTVRDTTHWVAPLSVKDKWLLAMKETADPFNFGTAFFTAAESQRGNQTPKFGEGWSNYGRRVYAAELDFASQNFFSAGLLATVLHQDPRYFRRGPQSRFLARLVYSVRQLVVAHQDSGRLAFNASNIGGMAMGIAASNLYYPPASRNGTVMVSRLWTSSLGSALGNLMSEFWPDVEQKFFRKK